MTYTTKQQAAKALEGRGFVLREGPIMGAAPWVMGRAYAWVSEEWSPRHKKMRFRTHMAGLSA